MSTSTVGFLGQTERGPVDPRLVTGFEQFQRLYGGYIKESYLAYAVDGFFRNGGQRCFVGRIVGGSAGESSKDLTKDTENTIITVKATGPGTWGDRIAVKVEAASLSDSKPELFKLTVVYWKDTVPTPLSPDVKEPTVAEVYDNLSPDPTSSDNYEKRVNGISNLIELEREPEQVTYERPDYVDFETLSEGNDESPILGDYQGNPLANPGERSGLVAFEEIDEISILCIPDEHAIRDLTDAVKEHCETMKDRFAILQAKQAAGPVANLRPSVNSTSLDSKYAAFYYPWIKVLDPLTNIYKLIPPGGHVAGIYARSDQERGVHKAPANEVVRGVSELQFKITKGDQDVLNPRGVNCIRAFPGRGIRVWGARTISSDPLWKYINIRRLFLFLEESIDEGTQWVVFE
ncbi:MAG: phage tail sheath family protein, partial [Methanophagales archaeon]|nr:phage tail sheath family protein [Methanophagales archaeon]